MHDIASYAVVAAIIALGGAVQAVAGFGYGLTAIPLLLIAGLDLSSAVSMVCAATIIQTAHGVYRLWHELEDLRFLVLPLGLAVLFVILGSMAQKAMDTHDPRLLRRTVGAVLALLVLVQALAQGRRPHIARRLTLPVFGANGFLTGFCGMGGPPVVLWTMAQDWTTARIRATLWLIFLALLPVQIAALYWKFGDSVLRSAGTGLLYFPVVLAASAIGLHLGRNLKKERLTSVALLVIFGLGMKLLVFP